MFEISRYRESGARIVRLRCDTCPCYVPDGFGGCTFTSEAAALAALERFLSDAWLWDATGRVQCEDCRDAARFAAPTPHHGEVF